MLGFFSFFIPALVGAGISVLITMGLIIQFIFKPKKNLENRIDSLEKELNELKNDIK